MGMTVELVDEEGDLAREGGGGGGGAFSLSIRNINLTSFPAFCKHWSYEIKSLVVILFSNRQQHATRQVEVRDIKGHLQVCRGGFRGVFTEEDSDIFTANTTPVFIY